jgi:hypothetical protein
VDIGGGRKVFVECAGRGSPAVVFESGDESDRGQWRFVKPEIAKQTRTCAYDRLGNGASDPPEGCRRMKDIRGDFEAVLKALRLDPPYVLVGTSGGGYLIAGFALAHPDQVAGLVFADTMGAINPKLAPPELLLELKCDHPSNQERRDYVTLEHEAWDHRRDLGDFPITVISNDYGSAATNEEERNSVRAQRGWLELSPPGRQVVVTSGHNVPENEPQVVVKEIRRVVDMARQS